MDDSLYFPEKVFVTKDSENLPITRRVLENTRHIPVEFIPDSRELIADVLMSRDPVGVGKKLLLVTHQKGEYVKPCPCTPKYIGCNYFVINTELNCPLDCSYCILQLYLDDPLITIHANTAKLFRQLDNFLHKNRNRTFRIGTGELGDSLALDHLTNRSSELISHFAAHMNALLELKTKTVNIENILEHKPPENIVVAWSLNSHKIAHAEEMGAPSVHDRIQAARIATQAGYRVKLRYPKPLRLRLFKHVFDDIKKAGGGEIPVYFCMESGDIWKKVQKKTPRSKKEVERLLTLPLGVNGF